MIRLLLINPNTSPSTTGRMVALAQAAAPPHVAVTGATARQGVPMIVDPIALQAAAGEVVEMGLRFGGSCDGIIVGAFGDPGLDRLRRLLHQPITGLAEASMRAAARGGRRFGVATVTPALAATIDSYVATLGLAPRYTGTRLTAGDPAALTADPGRLLAKLRRAVTRCVEEDGAEAVVIGGGPLGDAAAALQQSCECAVIAPITAAVADLLARLSHPAPA